MHATLVPAPDLLPRWGVLNTPLIMLHPAEWIVYTSVYTCTSLDELFFTPLFEQCTSCHVFVFTITITKNQITYLRLACFVFDTAHKQD